MGAVLLKKKLISILIKGLLALAYPPQLPPSFLLRSQEKVSNSVSIIKGLMPSRLRIDTLYHLYIKPLNGLTKPSSILSSISLPLLTASGYKRVTNGRLYLHR